MKIQKGLLKILHAFNFVNCSSSEEKAVVISETLEGIKGKGYDGVVINADFKDGYIESEANLELVKAAVRICKAIGLRVWIYDEKYYPSGAADVITLRDNPDLEARALVCVPVVLEAGEQMKLQKPYGHLEPMGAFGYSFSGEKVTDEDLKSGVRFTATSDGYNLINTTDKSSIVCPATRFSGSE